MTSYASNISQLESRMAGINRQDAQEAKKEADLITRQLNASNAASKTSSASTLASKLKDVERAAHDLAAVRKKRAGFSEDLARFSKSLLDYRQRQAKEDENSLKKARDQQKKLAEEQRRMMREQDEHERRMSADLRARRVIVHAAPLTPLEVRYDFFISHAHEDKVDFVEDLATRLKALGASVWYDEMTLRVGDKLRRSIDRGLGSSKFGVVVLSEHFFRKEWPQRELDGLTVLEAAGKSRILPIWHKVSKDEVARFSPTLADTLALKTATKTVAEIAAELMLLL